jgi:hypothetical protein
MIKLTLILIGQNLIINGDFENYITPGAEGMPLFIINPTPLKGTPDYYNKDFKNFSVPKNWTGFQNAYTGKAYCGIYIYQEDYNLEKKQKNYISEFENVREYIELQLTTTLQKDSCYELSAFLSLANISKYTSNDFGFCFLDSAIFKKTDKFKLDLNPQIQTDTLSFLDTLQWKQYICNYKAKGGENYLVFGNFSTDKKIRKKIINRKTSTNSIYVLIDNFSLKPCIAKQIDTTNSFIISTDLLIETIAEDINMYATVYDLNFNKIIDINGRNKNDIASKMFENILYYYQIRTNSGINKSGYCKRTKIK